MKNKYATQGAALRKIRERAGDITLADAGRHVGLSGPAIAHYESGRSRPDPEVARALDELYGASGEVVGLYGVTPREGGVNLSDLDEKLDRIINAQVDARVIGRTTAADATLAVTEALERLAHEVAELRRLVAQPAAAGRAHRRTDPTQ
jgi:transcriptional regulator with XRE-family HTH domain